MKQFILALIFLLATGGVAWAGKEAYKLVMSKDKEVCTAMLTLINSDMKEYGEIRYEEHEAFNAIQWKTMDHLSDAFKNNFCRQAWMAKFDISNRGTDRIVVRYSSCVSGNLSDSLYILDRDSEPTSLEWSEMFNSQNKIQFAGYILKELLPEFGMKRQGMGVGILYPFLFKGTYFVSMAGHRPDWIVVVKYKQAQEVEEVCYYHKSK